MYFYEIIKISHSLNILYSPVLEKYQFSCVQLEKGKGAGEGARKREQCFIHFNHRIATELSKSSFLVRNHIIFYFIYINKRKFCFVDVHLLEIYS